MHTCIGCNGSCLGFAGSCIGCVGSSIGCCIGFVAWVALVCIALVACIHTFIHTYLHIYIHTYICAPPAWIFRSLFLLPMLVRFLSFRLVLCRFLLDLPQFRCDEIGEGSGSHSSPILMATGNRSKDAPPASLLAKLPSEVASIGVAPSSLVQVDSCAIQGLPASTKPGAS